VGKNLQKIRHPYPEKGQLQANGSNHSAQEYKTIIQENEKLKQLLGEKDLEIAILRNLFKKKTNPHLLK
jgi:hypothetical protein